MELPSRYPDLLPPQRGSAVPSEITQIPMAGETILDKLFALKPGDVEVEPNLPQNTYYVMALERRVPVSYQALMGPNGLLSSYRNETQRTQMIKSYKEAMDRLREQAGFKPMNALLHAELS
jgi:hypothetical protein